MCQTQEKLVEEVMYLTLFDNIFRYYCYDENAVKFLFLKWIICSIYKY